jgi:hypothetical protein
MFANVIATELDRKIAATLKATAGGTAPFGCTVSRLNSTHIALKQQFSSGELTDAEYAKEASCLLNILGSFDGLIAEVANGTSR